MSFLTPKSKEQAFTIIKEARTLLECGEVNARVRVRLEELTCIVLVDRAQDSLQSYPDSYYIKIAEKCTKLVLF